MIHTYKRTLLLFIAIIFSFAVTAQPQQRTAQTKIVDALNQLPADNQKLYNQLMMDIESTGNDGVEMLISMLMRNDESRTKVEYALNAYGAYAGNANFDKAKKEALRSVLQKHIDEMGALLSGNEAKDAQEKPWVVSSRDLLIRMLRNIKGYKADIAEAAPDFTQVEGNLLKTLKSKDRKARMDAINAINTYGTKEEITLGLNKAQKALPKLSDDAKVDVLYWMGQHKEIVNTDNAKKLLWGKSAEVASAAAWTITRVGKAEDTKVIAALLKGNDTQKKLAESCLKSFPGNVTDAVVATLGTDVTPEALSVIAARKDANKSNLVFDALKSNVENTKLAAYNALKDVVREDNLPALYTELESCNGQYQPLVQDAIISALSKKDKKAQYSVISDRMNKVDKDKQTKYLPLAIKTADGATLLNLGRKFSEEENRDLQSLVFDAYFSTIADNIPGAQRFLMLRNAMDIAVPNVDNQNKVLAKMATTNVLPAVFYAGRFLDDACTVQAAAQAIRILTSGHNEMNGPEVRNLMKAAKDVITGQDAGYQKTEIQQQLDKLAKEDNGYVSLFNGKDLTGWKGLLDSPYDNPLKRKDLNATDLAAKQKEADEVMRNTWSVKNGVIVFNGKGRSLATEKKYGNFEMYVDWRLLPGAEPDAGIYLRGTPQVQIWDTARTNVGAEVGSGGLYNNQVNPSKPLCVADNAIGEWNTFYIKMVDERVTVYLNGKLVTDNVVLENYWDRTLPLMLKEQIELQAHGSVVEYRDIYIHELPQTEPYQLSAKENKEGFKLLFDGTNLSNFQGDLVNYRVEDGNIYVKPRGNGFGNLYTKEEYSDFVFRFEFKLTPGANNGIGVRAEMGKDAAYYGMEIQVLDHFNKIYQPGLMDYQYHGSVYGIIPTQNRNCLKPVGEWNEEEIYFKGNYVRVTLNGTVITEGDIKEATKNGNYDHKEHPGLFNKTGYIGFLGHGSELWFRNVRVKRLK